VRIDESCSHRFEEVDGVMFFDDCQIYKVNLTTITDVGDLLLYSDTEVSIVPLDSSIKVSTTPPEVDSSAEKSRNESGFKVWTGMTGATMVLTKDKSMGGQYYSNAALALENTDSITSEPLEALRLEEFEELESLTSVAALYNKVVEGCDADVGYITSMTPTDCRFLLDEHSTLWLTVQVTKEECVNKVIYGYLDHKRDQEELMQEAWAINGY